MKSRVFVFVVALGTISSACTGPGPGLTGNDTGGIIPWSPVTESAAFAMADEHCARYNKLARVTSVYRQPGHYIGFSCAFPRGGVVYERKFVLRTRG